MVIQNNYFAGTGTETVGYTVNGDADDWMYGEKDIYSMTPEVGSDFWTDASEIIPNCRANVWQNMVNAYIPHEFGWLKELSENKINEQDGFINYQLTRAGLTAGDLTVSLKGISDEILSTGNLQSAFVDNADNFDNWATTDQWGIDEEHFYSAPSSIGDSPNENYGRNENNLLQLLAPFDLSTVEKARLNFWAKWDIEQGFDYAQILADW